ncbi:substrate-binding domain-containing protein [Enterovibrio sp. ZSDZ35]|uniref:Autoinducer 2-binding periplasmic protein LuxP n=1 Tax=Enterovibrio qingdaonensis TaxID=2899818 RepID=A0ABT5QJY5_9GAMM|nr:substrate-binding domain-containing protein [Enterovibrio sp. ZSDZ35]MDD1780601.1 substrate-binding domain-containing protein [Enterovibrio sp. ZSDZ35]
MKARQRLNSSNSGNAMPKGLVLFLALTFFSHPALATIKAGVSVSDLTNPYFISMVRSIRDEMHHVFGLDAKLLVRSSAYDIPRQIRQLEEFAAEDVDVIFLVASDEHKIGPAVKSITRNGTPIVAIDVRARHASATVTTDNYQAGSIACLGLADALGGTGNALIINGPQVSSVIERVEGCIDVLSAYPNISLIDKSLNGTASFEGGLESMAYALQAFDDIDGIFAINDRTALGAEQAISQAGSSALIMSVDGSPAARDALLEKRSAWLGTATQFPDTMSREAVGLAKQLLNGHTPENLNILIPTKLMTTENAASFTQW